MTAKESAAGFELAEGQGYLLDRSHAAAVRLNYQHYLWREALGFTLHPSIPTPLPPLPATKPAELAIADVACGTGLWLLDAARLVPNTASLTGLDVDLKNAPVPAWLPPNVRFRHWDLFTDVPEDLLGRYDVVHVRLLILAIDGEEAIRPVVRNLYELLKPGGHLQWDEMDVAGTCIKRADPGLATPGLDALFQKSRAGGRFDWAVKLPDFIRREGFVDVAAQKYGDRDDLVRAFNDQHLLTMEEFAAGLAKIGKADAAKEFYRNIKDAYQESVKGAAICFPRVVAVARKPDS